MRDKLDELIICRNCQKVHKKVKLPHKKVAICSECGAMLYSNISDIIQKAMAFAITALFLFIILNLFPILTVTIAGETIDLTVPEMLYQIFENGFIVVGSIMLVVLLLAPLITLISFILLGVLSHFKLYKKVVRKIILFLIISREWAMVDIFAVSILVALVKLLGYAQIEFGVAFYALILFVTVDLFFLKTIRPTELWIYFERSYSEKR